MAQTPLPVITSCSGCGVCCMHMGYPAFMDPVTGSYDAVYWNSMPAELREELLEVIRAYKPPEAGELDGPCVWFDMDTRHCRHHEYRPQVCRDFPIGGKGCRDWRWHYRHLVRDDNTGRSP